MKDIAKNNIWYIIGLFLIGLGLLTHFLITQLFLEGDFFYFLRYYAEPYILWGFIGIGSAIILFHFTRSQVFKETLIIINQPISYFIMLSIVTTIISIILNGTFSIIFVAVYTIFCIILSIISSKNYIYLVVLASILILPIEKINSLINGSFSLILFDIIFFASIGTELYLIVSTVVKMLRKGIKRKELNLFFDFTAIFSLGIFFFTTYSLRTFGTGREILRDSRFPYASFLLIGYSTYMMFRFWKKHRLHIS